MLKLGIIPDAHGDSRAVRRLIKKCEKEGADALVLAGDIGGDFRQINRVLDAALSAKAQVIAFPGGHEPEEDYYKAIRRHKKIIDGLKTHRMTINGYDLVIIPGSRSNVLGAGFKIIDGKISKQYLGLFRTFKVENFAKYIRNPAKTALLCHDPPKCSTRSGLDIAYAGEVSKSFMIKVKHIPVLRKFYRHSRSTLALLYAKGDIMNKPFSNALKRLGYPVSLVHRNVGNQALRKFLKKHKIRFFACGHIHEAGQRAIISSGKALKPGTWSNSVWYNASGAIDSKCGMLIIENGKGMYKNIRA